MLNGDEQVNQVTDECRIETGTCPSSDLAGTSDQNVAFDELVALLRHLGFSMRTAGSHHIFSRDGVAEILICSHGVTVQPNRTT